MQEPFLTPSSLINELKKNKVTHVVWLPDSETNFMYNKMAADPEFLIIPGCREGEAIAVAAGLWGGGAKPVVLIQNTGLFITKILKTTDKVQALAAARLIYIDIKGMIDRGENLKSIL